jgi:hypothetical protein
MYMYLGRTLAVIALAAGTVIGYVTPASAAPPVQSSAQAVTAASVSTTDVTEDGTIVVCGANSDVWSPDGGAMVCFNPTGEHLYICDERSDGHHPGAWYSINAGAFHNPQYSLGIGNCHDLNLDMAESSWIGYQACNYEGSAEISCSGYKNYSANG